jgi:hypothetical protein
VNTLNLVSRNFKFLFKFLHLLLGIAGEFPFVVESEKLSTGKTGPGASYYDASITPSRLGEATLCNLLPKPFGHF